jgi:RND family efflux transporter MFP subunit
MKEKSPIVRQLMFSLPVLVLFVVALFLFGGTPPSSVEKPKAADSTDVVSVSKEGAKATDIEVATVHTEALAQDIRVTGQVMYPPDTTVKISPRLQGRVKEVFVRAGDSVKEGQTLAILDSVDAATARTTSSQNENLLRLAQKNLERAQRQFDLGTPEVTAAQAALDQAKTAKIWAKDALGKVMLQAKIGGFTEKPVEDAENALVNAKSSLSQAQSDFDLAQKDFSRKKQLFDLGVASKSDLEISQDTLEKTKANFDAGKDTVRLATQALDREQKAFKSNLYADQQVNQSRSAYEQAELQEKAAERTLQLAKAAIRTALEQAKSDLQSAQFAAQNSRQQLALLGQPGADGTFSITSPISGIVTERFVGPGQVVDQSQMTPWQMFTIAKADKVWVEASIYEQDLSAVSEGDPVHIYVTGLPNRQFDGRILHIAPAIDKTSRALHVRAEIDNASGQLKDGMYADVTIILPKGRQQVVIPLDAVDHDQDFDSVYVLKDGKYVKRVVKLGGQRDGKAIVLSGLAVGEQIVTHGALYLGHEASGD